MNLLNNNTKIKLDLNFEKDIFKNLLLFMFNNSSERFVIPDNIKKEYIIVDEETEDIDNIEKERNRY